MHYHLQPVRWSVDYSVEAEPLGEIVLDAGQYRATFRREDLGAFLSGDAAADAVWRRFLDHVHARHHAAARVHGGINPHGG